MQGFVLPRKILDQGLWEERLSREPQKGVGSYPLDGPRGLARDQLSAAKPCAGRGTPHCAGMEGSKGRLAKERGSTEKRGQLRELSTRTMTKSVQA